MLKPTQEEHRAPAATVVAPQLEVVLLARHPGDDVADAAPRVEAVVPEAQLRLARREAEKTTAARRRRARWASIGNVSGATPAAGPSHARTLRADLAS